MYLITLEEYGEVLEVLLCRHYDMDYEWVITSKVFKVIRQYEENTIVDINHLIEMDGYYTIGEKSYVTIKAVSDNYKLIETLYGDL